MSANRGEYVIGDIWQPSVTVTDTAGAAIDLSAYTVSWALKATRGGASYAAAGMPVSGSATSAGVVSATVGTAVTELVAAGTYWEEFEVSIAGGSPRKRSFQRQVTVVEQVIETA